MCGWHQCIPYIRVLQTYVKQGKALRNPFISPAPLYRMDTCDNYAPYVNGSIMHVRVCPVDPLNLANLVFQT